MNVSRGWKVDPAEEQIAQPFEWKFTRDDLAALLAHLEATSLMADAARVENT